MAEALLHTTGSFCRHFL